jgi:hypothetical protein
MSSAFAVVVVVAVDVVVVVFVLSCLLLRSLFLSLSSWLLFLSVLLLLR